MYVLYKLDCKTVEMGRRGGQYITQIAYLWIEQDSRDLADT